MFTDVRSRKIVLVAHCLLNQNAISDGTADFPGANGDMVRCLLDAGVGILQLPCPEFNCLGLDRGDPGGSQRPLLDENSRIRVAMGRPAPWAILEALVERVAYQVEEYRKHGFAVLGIIGSNRSPSCGVESTSKDGREVPGQGVFIEALQEALGQRSGSLPMIGIKASDPEAAKARVALLLAMG